MKHPGIRTAQTGFPARAQSAAAKGSPAAGKWGAGRMSCSGRGVWRWQPLPRFGLDQGRSAEIGTAGQTPALRLRAVVNLPWAQRDGLEISKPQRTLLEQQLAHSAVAGAVTMLSGCRGAELPAVRWEQGPFGNSARSAGYTCTIPGPDGSPAVTASTQFERRKLALGSCGRAYGTDCIHEHACVRCPVLIVDPYERGRLVEIRGDLNDRIVEAEREGWLGEVEGLSVSRDAAEEKLEQLDARQKKKDSPIFLGVPSFSQIAARISDATNTN